MKSHLARTHFNDLPSYQTLENGMQKWVTPEYYYTISSMVPLVTQDHLPNIY